LFIKLLLIHRIRQEAVKKRTARVKQIRGGAKAD
jgi:hypothetical protein